MLIIIFLAVSLSLDALGIGAAYGARGITIPTFAKLILTVESLLLMGLAILFGNRLRLIFSPEAAKYIGVILLLLMGFWLCIQGILAKKGAKKEADGIHAMNLLQTPTACDRDKSSTLDASEAILLGFVLSLDSLGAGLGAGAAGLSIIRLSTAIALFQIAFLTLGTICGKKIADTSNIPESLWSIISGALLIGIGVLRIMI